jgi:alcohol dehydrogenase class IV
VLGRFEQRILIGEGAIGRLDGIVAGRRADVVLLVCGGTSLHASGASEALDGVLTGRRVHRFDAFSSNPSVDEALSCAATARELRPDIVLGIGGGSALDVAKIAAVVSAQPPGASSDLPDPAALTASRRAALILCPTTAGTGSEVTSFATVWAGGEKRSLDHGFVRSDVAIVDPLLTGSMPASVRASTALDALGHAMESLWAVTSTRLSRRHAAEALELIGLAWRPGGAVSAGHRRALMSRAALKAGLAIDVTRTTAAHAFSYPLTGRAGIAHGAAVGWNLRWLLPYNSCVIPADCLDPRGATFVANTVKRIPGLLGQSSVDEVLMAIGRLLFEAGCSSSLADHGLTADDIPSILSEAMASPRLRNNPRAIDPTVAERLLQDPAGASSTP